MTTPADGRRLDRILVATDGSPRADDAVRFAVELASEYQSEVLFVHVVPMLDMATPAGPGRDQALLEDAAALASGHGVAAQSTLLVGSAAAEIVTYAESNDVNMIIVGSRGDGAMASALLGSVSLNVLRASGRPLLIVDGEKSVTYCGNGSCRDVRMYGHPATDAVSSPAPAQVPRPGDSAEDLMAHIEWAHARVASRATGRVAHSPNTGPGPPAPSGSRKVSASGSPERARRRPSLLELLSGAIRLETVVLVGDDVWAITATIPYEGAILLAEFTTRDSASEWFTIANALVRS